MPFDHNAIFTDKLCPQSLIDCGHLLFSKGLYIVFIKNISLFDTSYYVYYLDQTCPIMIQRLNNIFQRNPLISIGI